MRPEPVTPHASPYAGRDIPDLLAARARQRGDHPFLIWAPFEGEEKRWTYKAFESDVSRLAAGLHREGVSPGDRVLIHLDNCPEALIAWHACARLGAVAVTTNTRSTADELEYFATHCAPVGAITQPLYAGLVRSCCRTARFFAVTDADGDATVGAALPPDPADRLSRLFVDDDPPPRLAPDPWRHVSVQYTSGTTSRPKGVVWTHGNALWGGEISARHEGLTADDVHFVHLPLFHTNAQAYSALATLWAGASLVLAPRFSASRFWEAALKHRCTWSSMIPFNLRALSGLPVPDEHRFRYWGPAVSMPDAADHFGVRTFGWWGMTETITHGILGSLTEDEPFMSIGRCAPEYEIAIVDGTGAPCRPGETGDLLIRGVPGLSLFAEYLHNEAATDAAFDETGYMITGDRITLGEDGLLFFADRNKDMMKVGGENVAASEIERVALATPGVAEAAAVGRPDPMLDEVPVIFILPHPGIDEAALEASLAKAFTDGLADFKRPREIRLVEALPRSTLEKINKADLRAQLNSEGSPT